MLRNSRISVLSRFLVNLKLQSLKYSALFINGLKATDTYVFVTPYIDFPEHIKHKKGLQESIEKRKSSIDLNKLEKIWTVYENLKQRKFDLEEKKRETTKELTEKLQSNANEDLINRLKTEIHFIKHNLKVLKPALWDTEETAITEALKLPNILHPNTPETEDKVIFTHISPPTNNKNHLQIGDEKKLVQYKNNKNYYLLGDAAIFELGAKFYISQCLKSAGYIQFSNPDFVKSVIIEGCGEDHTNSDRTFILHHNEESKVNIDNRLHLTGGGSFYSFFAYHGKNVIYSKNLPIRYFSIGRQYVPSSSEDNLFNVSQSSVIQLFGVAKDEHEADILFKELFMILKNIYVTLGYHFRLKIVSADKLRLNESLKITVDMYSNSLNKYVEIANLAMTGDFISKRLMFTYVDKQKNNKFPHVICGTALDVPKLFGCVLEQDCDFTLPDPFKIHNWAT